ncbi:MAG: hypothetical protein HF312_15665 [Ignavibacteria bacterium]|jgi:uncharacterized protein YaeQ|nr:hypothetical protein [Ignavibacteria bacterium]
MGVKNMTPEEMAIKIYAESSRLDEGQVRFLMNLRDEDSPLPWEKIQAHHVRLFIELISRAIEVERNRCAALTRQEAHLIENDPSYSYNNALEIYAGKEVVSELRWLAKLIENGTEE